MGENSDDIQTAQPAVPKSWRQKTSQLIRQVWAGRSDTLSLTQEEVEHNRTIVSNTLGSFVALVFPLTLCFILVLFIMANFPFFKDKTPIFIFYSPIEEKESSPASAKIGAALLNALIFASTVIGQTVLLVILYKYKFYKFIFGFLIFSASVLLLFLFYNLLTQLCVFLNLPLDYITLVFLLLNYFVVGMMSYFTDLSLRAQQVYHIISTAGLSCILIRLFPPWTGWTILAALVVWDLVAVLTPCGPLKILVNLAQERQETNIFSTMIFKTMLEPRAQDTHSDNDSTIRAHSSPTYAEDTNIGNSTVVAPPQQEPAVSDGEGPLAVQSGIDGQQEEKQQGSMLGLGDFVFFSLLIGKASLLTDWNVTFGCYVTVIFGFFITYLILLYAGQALPALPVSLVLGLIVYFSTYLVISPCVLFLNSEQLLI